MSKTAVQSGLSDRTWVPDNPSPTLLLPNMDYTNCHRSAAGVQVSMKRGLLA